MEKMEFKSRKELEDYINEHQVKYLGTGIDGKCVLLDNGRVIKLLHNSYDSKYTLPFKGLKNSSFVFEDEEICIDNQVWAVLMNEAKGKKVSDYKPLNQDLLKLGRQLRVLTNDICEISSLGILIQDFHTGNLLYDEDKFTIIDTFQYLMLPGSNYKNDNLREVMTSRNGIYPFLLSEFMNCREFWINNSYYRRMDYIEYPDHYFEVLKYQLEKYYGEEIKTLGDAEMVLKRRIK